jgi:hypothetical protein
MGKLSFAILAPSRFHAASNACLWQIRSAFLFTMMGKGENDAFSIIPAQARSRFGDSTLCFSSFSYCAPRSEPLNIKTPIFHIFTYFTLLLKSDFRKFITNVM